jgi:hypothetical protein
MKNLEKSFQKQKVGRPKKNKISGNTHYKQPLLNGRHPLHITIK